MDETDEPHLLRYEPPPRLPIQSHETPAALVALYSWGTEKSPAYSLRVVRIIKGRQTCGRTYTASTLGRLRQAAPDYVGTDPATLEAVDQCLTLAERQGHFAFVDDEATP